MMMKDYDMRFSDVLFLTRLARMCYPSIKTGNKHESLTLVGEAWTSYGDNPEASCSDARTPSSGSN